MKFIHLSAAALALAGFVIAQVEPKEHKPAPAGEVQAAKAAFVQKAGLYPLDTCVVSGEKLEADAVTFTAGGRTFRTCCEKCQAKIEKDPAKFSARLDEAIVKVEGAHYPLDTCVVSGQKLGAMGEPVSLVLDGTLVKLCCPKCTKKAEANAPAMVAKVREAAFASQSKTYPLTTCVVSDKKLGDDAVSVMFGTTLVRFCCEKCVAKFEKDPAPCLQKLHAGKHEGGKDAAPAKPAGKEGKEGKDGGGCCDDEAAAGTAGCCAGKGAGAAKG